MGEGVARPGYMIPRKLDPAQGRISQAVGVLGMLGLTAYAGMILLADPKPGETVVVSAASGGVGQIAGQLARLRGAAGGRHRRHARRSAASSSRNSASTPASRTCRPTFADGPEGGLPGRRRRLFRERRRRGVRRRAAAVQRRRADDHLRPDRPLRRRARRDAGRRWKARAAPKPAACAVQRPVRRRLRRRPPRRLPGRDGALGGVRRGAYREDIREGLETIPAAFAEMLRGDNFGKMLVRIAPDPTLP